MRIYHVKIEHKVNGMNYDSCDVLARTFDEAVKKAKSHLASGTRIESVELLAESDY